VSHSVQITADNSMLSSLELSWQTAVFTAEDGIGPLSSLHEAGDSLVAVAYLDKKEGLTVLGSGVMVGPGLLVTATHVLDEFAQKDRGPVFLTFLSDGARAWLPIDVATLSKPSEFDESRIVTSEMSLVSCTLNSEAHPNSPLMLAPMQVALPMIGERLWAMGFRHQAIKERAALVTPLISSGLVTAAYPNGRGERMVSPCFEVNMDTLGGMSGGAVVNDEGYLVGILSSSFEGGPSYVTLIWEALRLGVRGAIPKLQASKKITLISAKAKGQVKLKGNVERNPWGDITFRLSEGENRLLMDSLPITAFEKRKPGLTEEERDLFLETWGAELEDVGSDAAIGALSRLSLPKVRGFFEAEDIPEHCLSVIESFTVEDFEGVEDMEFISTEYVEDDQIKIEYFFQLQLLIWTVKMSSDTYRQHATDFQEHFINVKEEDGMASMELIQRCFFKAVTYFDKESQQFLNTAVTSSAIRSQRKSINQ
jgi:hypothetical protein